MNVTAVEVKDWKKDDGTVTKVSNVTFEVGKPLPQGWEVATSAKGKPYIKVPKAGGKGGIAPAFRNSKEGQLYEQERMDRRTALMQAVALAISMEPSGSEEIDHYADHFYLWLRATAGTAGID